MRHVGAVAAGVAKAHADMVLISGHDGGTVVFEGTPADLVKGKATLTGQHLAAYVAG